MQTDSSASLTYLASVSAWECTTTVLMPSSRQARWTRRAISPRLAIRIFSNIRVSRGSPRRRRNAPPAKRSFDHEQGLAELDRLAILDQDRLDAARLVRFDLVEQLHRLDDAERVAFGDGVAHLDEGLRPGLGRAIEGAHHGRKDDVSLGYRGRGGGLARGGCRGRRRRGGGDGHLRHHGGGHRVIADRRGRWRWRLHDAHLPVAFGDLELDRKSTRLNSNHVKTSYAASSMTKEK